MNWAYDAVPTQLTLCNCSLCRRIGGLWAYGTLSTITVTAAEDATIAYIQGDKTLGTHTCRTCGCTTHWLSLSDNGPATRIAVNMRMADPAAWADIRVRHLDGADTWDFLD